MVSRMMLSTAGLLRAVPRQSAAQSLLERELGVVPQVAACRCRIGLRVVDVALARSAIFGRQRHTLDLLQGLPDMVERITIAVAGVVHFAAYSLSSGSLHAKAR